VKVNVKGTLKPLMEVFHGTATEWPREKGTGKPLHGFLILDVAYPLASLSPVHTVTENGDSRQCGHLESHSKGTSFARTRQRKLPPAGTVAVLCWGQGAQLAPPQILPSPEIFNWFYSNFA